ncbi:hypothetical protein F5X68DRAFT_243020 [Plectosphaerella plurivora]|uniref:Cyanovirin-N domain-containing protein n=1 Tax=Plectosphaerella plurivora TaxID=936078 RepID=A0A9P9A8E0_9PEZI|nr:hypothetical protein F5X68DRAFT_243020 [Plectosphaerella plurivora]
MAYLKKMSGAIAIAILVFANGTLAAADDSFSKECVWDRCKFRENKVMGTYCNNDNKKEFDYDWTQIDLGRCVGNNGGALVASEDGKFHESCDDCKLTNKHKDGTQYLVCNCWGTDDKKHESKLDLAEVLYNRNGKLGCFDHQGSKFDRPPPYWKDE